MSQANRMTFWSWYFHSARTNGVLVSAPRRVFGISIGIVLLIAWYLWASRTQPKLTEITLRVARAHPLCFLGIVLSFVLMTLRGKALEYLAYSVYQAKGVHLKWVLFFGIGQNELRQSYRETFGKDKFLRVPPLCALLTVLVMAISGLALVFTSR